MVLRYGVIIAIHVSQLFMKRLIIYFAAIVFFTSCITKTKSDDSVLKAALESFQKGNYEQSQATLQEYTQKYPEDARGWSFWGTVAVEMGNDSLAQVVLSRALVLDSKDYKAITGLGVIESHKKNYDKAEAYYYESIKVNPNYSIAYGSLSALELRRNNFHKAAELGEKATLLNPEDLISQANLSVAYHFLKQYNKRDSLIEKLSSKGYKNTDNLKLIFDGIIRIEDL